MTMRIPTEKELEERGEHARMMVEWGDLNSLDLPPHNPDATCPKCGADANRVTTTYHRISQEDTFMGWMPRRDCRTLTWLILGEHLCRTCGRCEYSWQERVVGTTDALAEQPS